MSQGYYIVRVGAVPGQPVDFCAPLEFFPPKGSDELHEALKIAYPFESNLSSRMRQAVIDFYLMEQQEDQLQSPLSSNQFTPEYLPSPQSTFVSTMPSPAMSAPSFNQTTLQAASPPAQKDLMSTFVLPNKPEAKVHTRRTMTAEEKKAYKQKRVVGACNECKRRRRKCVHDRAVAQENSSSQASSRKATKQKSRTTKKPTQDVASKMMVVPTEHLFSATPATDCVNTSFQSFTNELDLSGLSDGISALDSGFDLDSDWPLFPDLSSSGEMDVAMSPNWLNQGHAGSYVPAYSNTPLISSSHNVFASSSLSFSDTNATYALPPTPQSLQLTPMSRTQSGSSLSGPSDLHAAFTAPSSMTASVQSTSPYISDSFVATPPSSSSSRDGIPGLGRQALSHEHFLSGEAFSSLQSSPSIPGSGMTGLHAQRRSSGLQASAGIAPDLHPSLPSGPDSFSIAPVARVRHERDSQGLTAPQNTSLTTVNPRAPLLLSGNESVVGTFQASGYATTGAAGRELRFAVVSGNLQRSDQNLSSSSLVSPCTPSEFSRPQALATSSANLGKSEENARFSSFATILKTSSITSSVAFATASSNLECSDLNLIQIKNLTGAGRTRHTATPVLEQESARDRTVQRDSRSRLSPLHSSNEAAQVTGIRSSASTTPGSLKSSVPSERTTLLQQSAQERRSLPSLVDTIAFTQSSSGSPQTLTFSLPELPCRSSDYSYRSSCSSSRSNISAACSGLCILLSTITLIACALVGARNTIGSASSLASSICKALPLVHNITTGLAAWALPLCALFISALDFDQSLWFTLTNSCRPSNILGGSQLLQDDQITRLGSEKRALTSAYRRTRQQIGRARLGGARPWSSMLALARKSVCQLTAGFEQSMPERSVLF